MSTGYETGDLRYGEIPRDDNGDIIMPVALSGSVSWRGDIEWEPLVVDARIDAPARRDISTATASMLDDLAESFGILRTSEESDDSLRSRATNYARTWRYSPFDPATVRRAR